MILNSFCLDQNLIMIKLAQGSFFASKSCKYSVRILIKNVFEYTIVPGAALIFCYLYWRPSFNNVLDPVLKGKNLKRSNMPLYYSSLTVYHVNNLQSTRQGYATSCFVAKLEKNSTKLFSLIKLHSCPPLKNLQ